MHKPGEHKAQGLIQCKGLREGTQCLSKSQEPRRANAHGHGNVNVQLRERAFLPSFPCSIQASGGCVILTHTGESTCLLSLQCHHLLRPSETHQKDLLPASMNWASLSPGKLTHRSNIHARERMGHTDEGTVGSEGSDINDESRPACTGG